MVKSAITAEEFWGITLKTSNCNEVGLEGIINPYGIIETLQKH